MIRYHEALNQIHEIALSRRKNLCIESIHLLDSVGRIAAAALTAPFLMPMADNSAMDGFALRSSQTLLASETNPLSFQVLGIIAAGDSAESLPQKDNPSATGFSSYEIMTGTNFPPGYDACVKIEDCVVVRDLNGRATCVTIRSPLDLNRNLRPAGGDFSLGASLLTKGELIRPEHLLILAAFGIDKLEVFSKLKIALIATGKELVPFEKNPGSGQIRNSTQPYLRMRLEQLGATIESFLLSEDSPSEFKNLIECLAQNSFDMIISTGAVSMGQFDFVAKALGELKAKTYFHKLAIRPGKPILFAELPSGPVVFALPGNPISSVIGLRFFVESYISTIFSKSPEKALRVQLVHDYEKPKGFKCFLKAHLDFTLDAPKIEILNGQMSSILFSLLKANAWAILDEDDSLIKAQTKINVFPLQANPYQWISTGDNQ